MIDADIVGDREVLRKLGVAAPSVRASLVRGMGRITLKLMRISVGQKLSGQVLRRVTGTLARSVTQSPRTYQIGMRIIGTVGVSDITGRGGRAPVKYGRAHEYGFSGTVTVREHLRRQRGASRDATTVRAHSRRMHMPERSFLRSALRDLDAAGVIDAELRAAVAEGLREAQ